MDSGKALHIPYRFMSANLFMARGACSLLGRGACLLGNSWRKSYWNPAKRYPVVQFHVAGGFRDRSNWTRCRAVIVDRGKKSSWGPRPRARPGGCRVAGGSILRHCCAAEGRFGLAVWRIRRALAQEATRKSSRSSLLGRFGGALCCEATCKWRSPTARLSMLGGSAISSTLERC